MKIDMMLFFILNVASLCFMVIINYKFADVMYDKLIVHHRTDWRVLLFCGFLVNSIFIHFCIIILYIITGGE